MIEKIYQELVHQYFNEEISLDELVMELSSIIKTNVSTYVLPKEPVMLIMNHPSADSSLTIPATKIANKKGGNSYNFPTFWFPIIRYMLIKKLFGDRQFVIVANDIGWPVAMHEMSHLLISPKKGGRCAKIVSHLSRESHCSVVMFPEGGVRNLTEFHSGFVYIAAQLSIKHLLTATMTKELSLHNATNALSVFNYMDISSVTNSVTELIKSQKDLLRSQ